MRPNSLLYLYHKQLAKTRRKRATPLPPKLYVLFLEPSLHFNPLMFMTVKFFSENEIFRWLLNNNNNSNIDIDWNFSTICYCMVSFRVKCGLFVLSFYPIHVIRILY